MSSRFNPFICPHCDAATEARVKDMRRSVEGRCRRRRVCEHCGHLWTTYEISKDELDALHGEADIGEKVLAAMSQAIKGAFRTDGKKRGRGLRYANRQSS